VAEGAKGYSVPGRKQSNIPELTIQTKIPFNVISYLSMAINIKK
jgi:hypothetical protein